MKFIFVLFLSLFVKQALATPDSFLFGACVKSVHDNFIQRPEIELGTVTILTESEFYGSIYFELKYKGRSQCYEASIVKKDCDILSTTRIHCSEQND